MSDIVISPIPYNNGALATNHLAAHYVLLSPTQILHVAGQTNPNYIFAWVSTTTGSNTVKSTTPGFAGSPMRAILSFGAAPSTITNLRLWKLTTSRALLLINADLYVIEVSAQNDISVRAARANNFLQSNTAGTLSVLTNPGQGAYSTGGTSNYDIGSYLTGWYIRDNVVWFARRANNFGTTTPTAGTVYGVEMWKVTYDPVADTLTPVFLTRMWMPNTQGSANFAFTRTFVQSIPNSTKKLVYIRIQENSVTGQQISMNAAYANQFTASEATQTQPIAVIDSVNDSVSSMSLGNANAMTIGSPAVQVRAITPFSETKWAFWSNNNQYRLGTISGQGARGLAVTPAARSSQIFPTPATGVPVWYAEALDANYFLLMSYVNSSNTEVDPSSAGTSPYVRIGRIVDMDIAQINSATNTGNGLAVSSGSYGILDQEFIQRFDSETFLFFGRSAAGAGATISPSIRVWNQPGG